MTSADADGGGMIGVGGGRERRRVGDEEDERGLGERMRGEVGEETTSSAGSTAVNSLNGLCIYSSFADTVPIDGAIPSDSR